jgi:chromosome segregation ATPase
MSKTDIAMLEKLFQQERFREQAELRAKLDKKAKRISEKHAGIRAQHESLLSRQARLTEKMISLKARTDKLSLEAQQLQEEYDKLG